MIEIKNVTKRFSQGKTLFQHLRLEFDPGEFVVVTGPSGAGKTSLLQLVYGFMRPTEGSVHVQKRNLYEMSQKERALLRRKMGFIFQDFRLLPHFTVEENVALPLKIQRLDSAAIAYDVEQVLKRIGIYEMRHEHPETISGGAQQKVAVARAIVNKPKWLLADEPTGNLDPGASDGMMKLFHEIHQAGTSVIVATHDENIVRHRPGVCVRLEGGYVRGQFS